METLAFIGIGLLTLILMLFQHATNWLFRNKNETFGVILTALSYLGMFGLFTWAAQIW